ncbi:MAG: response regulator [Candidatus Omnitrophica bacterium]|nr:response regulator [Candidatus Omnitrophota bacterium]
MNKGTILIADDEKDIIEMLEKKLRQNDFQVLAFSNGKDALDGCRRFRPDLVLMDIAMPDMDGYSVGLALREDADLKRTPIIFMTAKELEYSGIEKRLSEIANCDFVTKPCSLEDLLSKIKAAKGGRHV